MSEVAWRLDARFANLSCGPLAAGIDLFTPLRGLTGLSWYQHPLAGWQVLGVEIDSLTGQAAVALVEKYVRGGDLVATYEPTPTRPFAVQIYWRATVLQLNGQALPLVTLQVSINTKLQECQPALALAGLLPECETVDFAGALGRVSTPVGRLFRPSELKVSYAQWIDPAGSDTSESTTFTHGTMHLATRLFSGDLEKGVILRQAFGAYFCRGMTMNGWPHSPSRT